MKLKVCGMKYVDNILKIAELRPDYMGFIFYDKSKRNFEGIIPEIPKGIKKTGVFVNEIVEIVVSLVEEYQLEAIQLHGDENVEYIEKLRNYLKESTNRKIKKVEVFKVFGIKEEFNFDVLKPYEEVVDCFLFDTKGKERGGNGVTFDWRVLEKYNSTKPFILSGGIGLEEANEVKTFFEGKGAKYCIGIDVNSKFETRPGLKSVDKIQQFKNNVITNKVK